MLCQDSSTKCVCVGHRALGCQSVPEVTNLISVCMSLKCPFFSCIAWLLSRPRLWHGCVTDGRSDTGNCPRVGTVLWVCVGSVQQSAMGFIHGPCSSQLFSAVFSDTWGEQGQPSLSVRDLSCWNDPEWTVMCWRLSEGTLSDLSTTAPHISGCHCTGT